jgi:glutathione S-transferase
MKLIGMLDSPYVRRVAISLEAMNIPFAHEAVSVFRDFEKFKAINPAVKAPTFICDDGEVLMDSSLILQYVETITGNRSLWSVDKNIFQTQMRAVSLALAACEKSVQIFYELNLRAPETQSQSWLARIQEQMSASFAQLELLFAQKPDIFRNKNIDGSNHPGITSAVVWQFAHAMLGNRVLSSQYPLLQQWTEKMEATPAFLKYPPIGPGANIGSGK